MGISTPGNRYNRQELVEMLTEAEAEVSDIRQLIHDMDVNTAYHWMWHIFNKLDLLGDK
jgi:hypothetical protein